MIRSEFIIPKSAEEARAIQTSLRDQVRVENDFDTLKSIAGVDVGYDPANNLAHASIVTMPLDTLRPQSEARAFVTAEFPYIPGLLSFREIPAILAALEKLPKLPDLLMVDGQGIAHPRRLGIASHLGVILDKPTIGVAKSRLVGRHDPVGSDKGDTSPLMDKGEQIGVVLRSRDHTNPLFVSPGHRVDIKVALEITLKCLTRYRLPEPTRLADKLSKVKNVGLLLNV